MSNKGYAIIRGGCSGAGREISMRLAAEGYDIVGNFADINQSYKGEQLIKDVAALGVGCIAHNGDLRDFENVKTLFETARGAFGDDLAVFVNNGGIFDGKRLPELDIKEYEELTAIHINALLHCVKLSYPLMQARGGGAFINVTSISAPMPGESIDTALERSLFDAFTRSLAKTLDPYNMRMNSILSAMTLAPGETPPPPPEATPLSGAGHDRMCFPFSDKGTTDTLCDWLMYIINSPHITGQVVCPNLRV